MSGFRTAENDAFGPLFRRVGQGTNPDRLPRGPGRSRSQLEHAARQGKIEQSSRHLDKARPFRPPDQGVTEQHAIATDPATVVRAGWRAVGSATHRVANETHVQSSLLEKHRGHAVPECSLGRVPSAVKRPGAAVTPYDQMLQGQPQNAKILPWNTNQKTVSENAAERVAEAHAAI